MEPFEFHGELFELRSNVIEALAEQGFVSLKDYGAVDLQHDIYGLEITAIRDETDAKEIENLLRTLLPDWRHARTFYEDHNSRELGWKVMISRSPEIYDDVSPIRRSLVPFFDSSNPWYLKIAAASAYGLIIAFASVLVGLGLNFLSRAEIVATLILLPTFFALAATILAAADMIRRRKGRLVQK